MVVGAENKINVFSLIPFSCKYPINPCNNFVLLIKGKGDILGKKVNGQQNGNYSM